MSSPDTRYSSVPRDEEPPADGTHVSSAPKGGLFATLNNWFGNSNETAPLINRNRMTLEPPRKSNTRIAFEIVSIVGFFILVAVIILVSFVGTDEVGGIYISFKGRGE